MNSRAMTPVYAAVDTCVAAAIVFAVALAPLLLMWLFQDGMQTSWTQYVVASAAVVLLAYGVPLDITADLSGLVGTSDPVVFTLSLAPLTLTAVLVTLAVLSGRRGAGAPQLFPSWIVAVVVQVLLVFGLTQLATVGGAVSLDWRAWVVPPLLVLAGQALGGLTARVAEPSLERRGVDVLLRMGAERVGPDVAAGVRIGVRAAIAVIVALVGLAAVVLALVFLVHWMSIATLFESLHVGVMGLLVLGIAQFAFLGNVLVWAIAWLSGVGFAFGQGSSIGPLGTNVGPIPTIPILGALPQGQLALGLAVVLIPVLAGVAGALVVQRANVAAWHEAQRPLVVMAVGCGVAAVGAGAVFGLLGWWSGGSLGPGRLSDIGVNGAALWLALALEFAVGLFVIAAGTWRTWSRRMADQPRAYADPLIDRPYADRPTTDHTEPSDRPDPTH